MKAVADKTGGNFGNIKIGFDVGCVILSLALSLIFFNGKIVGTREGTIMTALLTGLIVKFFVKIMAEPLNGLMSGSRISH